MEEHPVRDKAVDAVHGLEHPIETVKALEHEAEVGESARTPLIAVTGITIVMGVVFAIFVTGALVLYYVYGGK